MQRILVFLGLLFLPCFAVVGQASDSIKGPKYDTAYYELYDELLTTRVYYSKKFTGFNVNYPELGDVVLKYAPNTTNNLGVGATYRWATLNLAYGFGFMNPDRGQGDTRYLDLQMHQYLDQFVVDIFGQFYRGYYLKNDKINDEIGEVYVRDDIRVNEVGASVKYLFNHEKLSLRASFVNNARQKKSAGSFMLGWDFFYGTTKADSTLIPFVIPVDPAVEYDAMRFLKSGPTIGYIFTLVLGKRFFVTGGGTVDFNFGYYQLENAILEDRQTFFSQDLSFRAAVGYNVRRFTISAFFVNQSVQFTSNYRNILNVGNIRAILTYRFDAPDFLPKLFNSQ